MRKNYFLTLLFLSFYLIGGRVNAQMALDNSFNNLGKITLFPGGFGGFVKKILLQPDGKIVLCGYTATATANKFVAVRLDSLGQPDLTFGAGSEAIIDINGMDARCFAADLQDDGKIVMAGYVISGPPTETDLVLVRLDADGNLDGSFGTGGIVITPATTDDDLLYSCEVLASGQILVGGKTGTGANANLLLAQYNSDGTGDMGFGSLGVSMFDLGHNDNEVIYSLTETSNGRVFAGGYQMVNGFAEGFVIQLLSDGTIEPSFAGTGVFSADVSGTHDEIRAIGTDGNGNIYATGSGSTSTFMFQYKLFPDGSLDSSYAINGLITNTSILGGNAIGVDSSGGTYVVGSSGPDYGVLKYRETGVQDTLISAGGLITTDFAGDTDMPFSVKIQPNGKVIVAGTSVIGMNNFFSASRYAQNIVSSDGIDDYADGGAMIYPNPASGFITLRTEENYSKFLMQDISGRTIMEGIVSGQKMIQVSGIPGGMYILRLSNDTGGYRSLKMMIER